MQFSFDESLDKGVNEYFLTIAALPVTNFDLAEPFWCFCDLFLSLKCRKIIFTLKISIKYILTKEHLFCKIDIEGVEL